MNGVHDTTVKLAHDFVLGLRHDDSLEQGRDTHAMLREGSEDDRPGQTDLRELIRIILAFDTLRTVGNSLGRGPSGRHGCTRQPRPMMGKVSRVNCTSPRIHQMASM